MVRQPHEQADWAKIQANLTWSPLISRVKITSNYLISTYHFDGFFVFVLEEKDPIYDCFYLCLKRLNSR